MFCVAIVAVILFFAADNSAECLMALTVVTPDIKRGYLSNFVEYIKARYGFNSISEMDLRPYMIRLLWDLENNKSSYSLDPRYGYSGANPNLKTNELLLDDKKIFSASELRVATRKIDASNILGPVFTYEDILHHDDSNEAVSLHALYNGVTSLTTDNIKRITNLSNDLFRVVPNRLKAENADVVTQWPQYGPETKEKGFVPLIPMPILDSSKTNTIQVDLKGSVAAIAGAAGKKNILQVDLLGWVFDPASSGGFGCGGL